MLASYLQEEIVQAHLYGSPDTAYAMRRVAWNLSVALDQEYIENAIATAIRNMRQDDFNRWLDERSQRDKNVSAK
jgi:hypothetical protein